MPHQQQVIALAGVGDVGRYVCEELIADDRFDVVVLSRNKKKWFEERNINVHETDYDEASVIAILDSTNATALISFIQLVDSSYVDIHRGLVNACVKSKACKRIIPSEWTGNLDDFPMKPTFYGITREPIRKILRETSTLQWTLFNQGFFMDYFLPAGKTYLKPIPDEFPVDPNGWKVCIRGTGDEPIAFTLVREVAKAVVELLTASEWEPITYVAGEWTTFNKSVEVMQSFYGRPLPRTSISVEEIQRNLLEHERDGDAEKYLLAQVDEWVVCGGCAVPKEKTLRQREKYFSKVKFSTLQELLERAEKTDFL